MTSIKKYNEFKNLPLTQIEKEVLDFWKSNNIFERSITEREGKTPFVFYEGPPSANGLPGIHHVLSRAIKDIFCRYKTLKGFQVKRKGGWDTHGLPIELSVEKTLGITKKDIGVKITVEEYNLKCRDEVLKYKDIWDDLTQKMGYWVDLDNPYITFENNYIESVWYLMQQLYNKGFLYKGKKIQPFSPAAGTGLSTHELNQPGAYRDVKDTSAVAQFKLCSQSTIHNSLNISDDIFFLAWTTTPWTLPSNTALAVGAKIEYVLVKTFNPYTHIPVNLILAKELVHKYFNAENEYKLALYQNDGKNLPFEIVASFTGKDFENIRYEQLLPFDANTKDKIDGDAFKVILGDFVTTSDGTGIVHIAPSFGADDMKVAGENGIGTLTLVDKEGKFIDGVGEFSGRYVKDYKDEPNYVSVDIDISVKLKKENKAFKVEKYEHSYPHCYRTDKPVIYYPLDSWFVKVTAVKERMVELNKTINWKPESTGSGRFGQWLDNLLDWNLSRSRFWGTPLNIWRSEDGLEEICIGSIEELYSEIQKSVAAGFLDKEKYNTQHSGFSLDLHKPFVDDIILVSSSGKPMKRESDLIDVWFDSGAVPYAQWHYPFENIETFKKSFPADFIAEGVDQTRGWFYTLHAIAVMLFDSVAYKNVVSNGLVLDKNGNKMSKSKGNAVDPFAIISQYGADTARWYMISNSQPWDNLKFDISGIEEVSRKLFSTLTNTYSFFALYANIDGFDDKAEQIPIEKRPEIDQWIISLLNTLIKNVDTLYAEYEPTKAAREIQEFINNHLSNWYVRLSRRRFWKTDEQEDKMAAYQTLHQCLVSVVQLMSPIAPFYSDYLFQNLNLNDNNSVHLSLFPVVNENVINKELEERMQMAQTIASLVLSLRKKETIKVRQPLQKILIPNADPHFIVQVDKVKDLILSEVNVKEIEFISDTSGIVSKKVKPNFKLLGKKLGDKMKIATDIILNLSVKQIQELEKEGSYIITIDNQKFTILAEEVEIISDDIEGWLVASNEGITVALDINITESLKNEGFAREIVNKIQNERKDLNFQVTDKINIHVQNQLVLSGVLNTYKEYICNETLAIDILFIDDISDSKEFDINGEQLKLFIQKI